MLQSKVKIENRKTHITKEHTHTHLYFLFIIFLQVIICSSILFYFLTINDTNQKGTTKHVCKCVDHKVSEQFCGKNKFVKLSKIIKGKRNKTHTHTLNT